MSEYIIRKATDEQVERVRQMFPEHTIIDKRPRAVWWVDPPALWLALFGVWPIADPGHSGSTIWSAFDIGLHVVGAAVFLFRWRLERR